MSMVYSVMVYLEQHFGKFWDFIVVVVHEMIEFNPLPFKTDSIDSVAKGAHNDETISSMQFMHAREKIISHKHFACKHIRIQGRE